MMILTFFHLSTKLPFKNLMRHLPTQFYKDEKLRNLSQLSNSHNYVLDTAKVLNNPTIKELHEILMSLLTSQASQE